MNTLKKNSPIRLKMIIKTHPVASSYLRDAENYRFWSTSERALRHDRSKMRLAAKEAISIAKAAYEKKFAKQLLLEESKYAQISPLSID